MTIPFSLPHSLEILERTPATLRALLSGLSDEWIYHNEGPDTFSPFDVVGHLIHGERTDWIPRMEIILSDRADKTFEPYDRFAQQEASKGKTLPELLDIFETLRQQNLQIIHAKNLTTADLQKTGIHPAFGIVTLQQLLAALTVHDLGHIAQVARVMAKQYKAETGPWQAYLPVLTRK